MIAAIPNRFDFSEGEAGYYIDDGGNDMYDGGNYLSTDLGGLIEYSNDAIVSSSYFGSGGRYFTKKYPGLFVLVADMEGVNHFEVSGDLGADGSGYADGAFLQARVSGINVYGFVKRVYGAGDPSVNHLIIIEENPAASHEFSTYTDDDYHRVLNLADCQRIYYALYAGGDGLYIDNAATLNIMETFLNSLGLAPEWVRVVPGSGTVPAGSNIVVDVTFDASGQYGGDYDAMIVISNNDPLRSEVLIPAHLQVTGAPDIAVSDTVLNYGPLFIGATVTDTLAVSNEGTDVLVVSEISSSDEDYTVDAASFNLAPGASRNLAVTFAPTMAAPIPATLTITSNDVDEGVVEVNLRGEGLVPPVISVTPDSLADSLFTRESSTDSLTICNTGGSDLTFRVVLQTGTHPASAVSVTTATRTGSRGVQMSRAIVAQPRPTDVESNGLGADETANRRFDVQDGTALKPATILLSDGFEDGNFDGWQDGGGSGIKEVTNATAANATMYSYHEHDSQGGHFKGIYQDFGPVQPRYVGFYIRSGSTTDDDAFVVLRSSRGYEAIGFFAKGNGFLYCNADVGGDRSVPYEAHRWYHIEFKDIDFTSKSFDYYVDNVLVKAGVMLRNVWAVDDICRLDIYNFTTGAEAWWDEFWMSTGEGPFDWLSVDPISSTIPPGSCTELFVTFNAAWTCGGDYDANIVVSNNDPLKPNVVVPARLHVTRVPEIAVSDTVMNYGPCFIGATVTDTLMVSNEGTDVLVVSDVSSDETDYAVDVTNFALDPGANRPVAVTFAPKATGPRLVTLTVTSNDPDEGVVEVSLRGEGLAPPVISVTPESLADSLFSGGSSTQQLIIDNSVGGSELIWNASVRYREDTTSVLASSPVFGSGSKGMVDANKNNNSLPRGRPDASGVFTFASRGEGVMTSGTATSLETILSHLNANYAAVTGAIPNRFDFSEGEGGYRIDDGGLDMYDGGNYLWTDLGGPVGYSNGGIVSVPCFGTRGRYFTSKYPGLFALVADMEAVNHFEITGNLGADSAGCTDGALLQARVAGVDFYGFVKRVYGAGDPSVNHLVIIEENPAATHEFATNTNNDYHRVFSLTACRRIYYVLYAGANGFYIDDTATLGIMEAFLHSMELSPEWVRVVASSGTTPAGEGANVDVAFSAMGMKGGDYIADILVTSNDPIKPEVTVPTYLHVAGSSCGIPEIVSYDPSLLTPGNCSEGCTASFIVDTQDDYSAVTKITLERYLQGMWIPEDSLLAPLPAPTWRLACNIDGHYTDGEHVFHVVFHCGDGSKGVSETTTIIADRGVPIAIRSFEPEYSGEGIVLRWGVADGATLQGFNIYKSLGEEVGFGRINTGLIPADQDNEYVDMDVSPATTYWYRLGAVAVDGEWMSPTVSITVPVLSLALYQNTPNPFNPTTSIQFALPHRSKVTLSIYDVEGRRIRTLVDEVMKEGYQERIWDGRDASGNQVSSGVYFYRLTADNQTLTKKMIVLK